jgi:heptosyltransferase I
MHILITKLSSMGDLIHLLPALTDAMLARKDLSFDWAIDHNFSEVASWHPAVKEIIPTNHRVWRSTLLQKKTMKEMLFCIRTLRKKRYDLIIDAQGNLKSALISLFAKGPIGGFDGKSVIEWGAHFTYKKKAFVSKDLHAIERLRTLFAKLLDYPLPSTPPSYGICTERFFPPSFSLPPHFLIFVPIASYPSKLYPEHLWKDLIEKAKSLGYPILLPWGNKEEKERVEKLATTKDVIVLPKLVLSELGYLLQKAKAVVSVDTGLSHLAAALNTKAITLYGPTDPKKTGTIGNNQFWISSPCHCFWKKQCSQEKEKRCLEKILPDTIFQQLSSIL